MLIAALSVHVPCSDIVTIVTFYQTTCAWLACRNACSVAARLLQDNLGGQMVGLLKGAL